MTAADANAAGEDVVEMKEQVRRRLKEAMVAREAQDLEPLRCALETACALDPNTEDVRIARELLHKVESQMQPLTFTDVSCSDMEALQATTTRQEAVKILMRCMKLRIDHGFQAEILAEFHYHNFLFCQRNKFGPETTSTFLSLMKVLHTKAIVQDKLRKDQAQELFERLLKRHSRALPPYSFGAFLDSEALLAREYAGRGFFRHYAMYAFAYCGKEELTVSTLKEQVTLKVPEPVPLFKCMEIDPASVPELNDFSSGEQASHSDHPSLMQDGLLSGAGSRRSSVLARAYGDEPEEGLEANAKPGEEEEEEEAANEGKAELEAAIDAAFQAHLGDLHQRLGKHPLAS